VGGLKSLQLESGMHNVKLTGEGASARQIFNAHETGLYWKQMPCRTFLVKNEESQPGYKTSEDCLTLLWEETLMAISD
jgi:hypothetical protein